MHGTRRRWVGLAATGVLAASGVLAIAPGRARATVVYTYVQPVGEIDDYYGGAEAADRPVWTGDADTRLSTGTGPEGGPPPVTRVRFARFTFVSDSDPEATFECRLDEGDWTSCGPSHAFYDGLAEGEHHFAVRSVTNDGVADATPAELSWRIDTVAPDTTLLQHPNGSPATAWFFDPRSPDPTVQRFVWIDDGVWTGVNWPSANWYLGTGHGPAEPGPHRAGFAAEDPAGNIDATPVWFDFTLAPTPYDPRIMRGEAPPWPGMSVSVASTRTTASRHAVHVDVTTSRTGRLTVRLRDASSRLLGVRRTTIRRAGAHRVKVALRRPATRGLQAQRRMGVTAIATLRPADGSVPMQAKGRARLR